MYKINFLLYDINRYRSKATQLTFIMTGEYSKIIIIMNLSFVYIRHYIQYQKKKQLRKKKKSKINKGGVKIAQKTSF